MTTTIKKGYYSYGPVSSAWDETCECEHDRDETLLCSYINIQDLIAVLDDGEDEIEVQWSETYTSSYGKRYYCLPLAMYERETDCPYPIWTVKGDILIYRPEGDDK